MLLASRARWWALFGLVVAGCGSPHPLDRINEIADQLYGEVCLSCPAALAAASADECHAMAERYVATPDEMECIREVYDAHVTELGPSYADCYTSAWTEYDGCVRETAAGCPPPTDDVTGCLGAFGARTSTCPRPSPEVASMFQSCGTL